MRAARWRSGSARWYCMASPSMAARVGKGSADDGTGALLGSGDSLMPHQLAREAEVESTSGETTRLGSKPAASNFFIRET